MLGIYLSGSGNTKHCVEKLMNLLDQQAVAMPIENEEAAKEIENHSFIILGYMTQYSNIPVMVRDFIREHKELWKGKEVFCITTMGLFAGDGTGCAARLLTKYGAKVVGGLQIRMPDSICDEKLLKNSAEKNREIISSADVRLEAAAEQMNQGNYPKEGLGVVAHMKGLFGQRLWFYNKTQHYTDKLKISDACKACGLCAEQCPMHNLTIQNGKVVVGDRCTMCYRCLNHCPQKAMTLLGKEVHQQYRVDLYH